MDQKKRLPGLIEHNKVSPFQILDVRSINENVPTTSYTLQQAEAAEAFDDDSSGSEKELVIDMEDAEAEPPDDEDFVLEEKIQSELPMHVVIKAPPSPSPPPPSVPTNTAAKGRINRRKSQHVRLDNADMTFEEPAILETTPSEAEAKGDELQEGIDANRTIMQHVALLRTAINYLLQQHHQKTIPFPNGASDFETMDSWMECYEQLKCDSLPGTSRENAKK
ncbi:uncharacterized protein LOC126565355 [Anopheles maculipalpis]|uniref:uncharacterized protein LOC126565355 n=1 Tax=Anopheles maculipalpis TaxID=1496333 RepID=UPI002158D938|nr:uncharacterized protein LOC126565355 [Anopheles maculipalpis]